MQQFPHTAEDRCVFAWCLFKWWMVTFWKWSLQFSPSSPSAVAIGSDISTLACAQHQSWGELKRSAICAPFQQPRFQILFNFWGLFSILYVKWSKTPDYYYLFYLRIHIFSISNKKWACAGVAEYTIHQFMSTYIYKTACMFGFCRIVFLHVLLHYESAYILL